MNAIVNCYWHSAPSEHYFGNITVRFNADWPEADVVVDMGNWCSPRARSFPPEKRVYVFTEPSPFHTFENQGCVHTFNDFYKGALFSWHKALQHLSQYRPFVFCFSFVWGQWRHAISEGHHHLIRTPSDFAVGGIFAPRNNPLYHGYAIRKRVIEAENLFVVPTRVYHSGRTWCGRPHEYPQKDKCASLQPMFHFAIENTSEWGYVSDKVMDCLLTKCVPLYWGAPNIGGYFNPDGIICLDENRLVEQVNALTPDDYYKRLPAVEDNYQRALQYVPWDQYMIQCVEKWWRDKQRQLKEIAR